jgi:quercetin dioxygenase-like cupin family protein
MRALSLTLAVAALGLGACEVRDGEPANAQPAADDAVAEAAGGTPVVRTASDSSLQWGDCPAPLPAGCQLTVLNGDPAKPNADVLLRIPAGGVIPPHTHSSAERMMLVEGRLDVRYQGAQPATLLPGTYAYGPAKLPHTATCMSGEACTLFIAFEGPVDVAAYEGAIE